MSDILDGRAQAPARLARPALFTALIALLWILPGLIGHDPWRQEALSIALVAHIVQSGDWVVPTLAGTPLHDVFPLYHLTAALLGIALDGLLPLHDAARLASGLYMALAFAFVALATRELLAPESAWLGPLALMGCIGLVAPVHSLTPDSAQVAAFSVGLYGLALVPRRAIAGGVAIGIGAGAGFLANGLLAPLSFALSLVSLPILSAGWRNRQVTIAALAAIVALLPWLFVWPALLHAAAPDTFSQWWSGIFSQQLTASAGTVPVTLAYFLGVLPWFAFPALPLALWALWARRGDARLRPSFAACVVLGLSVLVLLAFESGARQRDALPFLVPVAVLAVAGVEALRRGAANAFWWFSILFGSIMVLMGWFEWSALDLGFPAARQRHWIRQQPAYVPDLQVLELLLALAITGIWAGVIKLAGNRRERPLMAWSGGVAVVWALALGLFVDYADLQKSYRPVAQGYAQAARGAGCVAARDIGQSQQGLLSYLSGVALRPERLAGDCDMLLVQGQRNVAFGPVDGWEPVWEGARPGERREVFRLYRRAP